MSAGAKCGDMMRKAILRLAVSRGLESGDFEPSGASSWRKLRRHGVCGGIGPRQRKSDGRGQRPSGIRWRSDHGCRDADIPEQRQRRGAFTGIESVAWLIVVAMETSEVDSLPGLVEESLRITQTDPDHEWWFRGHGRKSFTLLPSLYRYIPDVVEALEMEGRLLREFDNRSRTIREAAGARDPWEILFLMQHHRLSTRLLDWSRNLLIATYFAVHDEAAWGVPDDGPCVFVLTPHAWNKNVLGTAGVAGSMGPVTDLSGGTMTGYAPRYSGSPVGPLQADAVAIAGPEFAARIVAQRGTFTVFGTKAPEAALPLEEQDQALDGPSTLARLDLQGRADEWERALRLVGIGAYTAFPDLDGLARELRNAHLGRP